MVPAGARREARVFAKDYLMDEAADTAGISAQTGRPSRRDAVVAIGRVASGGSPAAAAAKKASRVRSVAVPAPRRAGAVVPSATGGFSFARDVFTNR